MMTATNPQFSNFKFAFPTDFFKSEIIGKYDEWFKINPQNVDNIGSTVNQSIQTVTMPSLGLEPIIQVKPITGGGIETGYNPVSPFENLVEDKNFSITLKHVNGFMTYFVMMEHYFQYADAKNGTTPDYSKVPDLPISVYDNWGNILFNFIFQGVIFTGMDELELSKSKIHNEFTTFDCRFRFDSYKLDFHTPEKIKTHV